MKVLNKGYSNNTQATTPDTFRSEYNLQFATAYNQVEEPTAEDAKKGKKSVLKKLFKNLTSTTTEACEYIWMNLMPPSGLKFEGYVADLAKGRKKKKGAKAVGFTLMHEGWDYVNDDTDAAFDPYTLGHTVKIQVFYEEDDLITPEIVTEWIERSISDLTRNDGGTSRIVELMNGAYNQFSQ